MLFPLNSGPISKTCTGPQKRTEEGVGFGARKGTWKIIGNLKFASQLNPNSPSWLETTDLSQFLKSPLFEPPTSPADADFGPHNLDLRDWGDRTTNRPETEARLHATGDHQATEVVPPEAGSRAAGPAGPAGFWVASRWRAGRRGERWRWVLGGVFLLGPAAADVGRSLTWIRVGRKVGRKNVSAPVDTCFGTCFLRKDGSREDLISGNKCTERVKTCQ